MKKILLTILFIVISVLFAPTRSYAAISFVASTTATFSAVSSFTINVPTGTANGNLLFATYGHGGNSGGYLTDTQGFTSIQQLDLNGTAFEALYKVASSEGSSYTFNFGTARNGAMNIVAYSGTDTTSPFDVDLVGSSSANPKVTPSITPSQTDSLLIGVAAFDTDTVATFTEVAGYPLKSQAALSAQASVGVVERLQTSIVTEGTQVTVSQNGASSWTVYTAAFKPAVGGGGGATPYNPQSIFWF